MMWCGLDSGRGRIITSHPALEGTFCEASKWCELGACVQWTESRVPPSVQLATISSITVLTNAIELSVKIKNFNIKN